MRNWITMLVLTAMTYAGISRSSCADPEPTPHAIIDRALHGAGIFVMKPQLRTITRIYQEPTFIEPHERARIHPSVTAYVESWRVDIGDRVKKGEVLVKLFAPGFQERWETTKALVKLHEKKIELALGDLNTAEADLDVARAKVAEAKLKKGQHDLEVKRWEEQAAKDLEIFYEGYKEMGGVWHFTRLKLRTDESIELELRDLEFPARTEPEAFKKPR
jgi:HlyD family secretion protein